jgi:CO/xanthine dehydrogenase FAD-binding subunit
MTFSRPATVEEAVNALVAGEQIAPLAGGATLMAIANAGLVELEGMVGLAGLEELRATTTLDDGTVRIGAMRLHRETAAFEFTGGQQVLADAASQIANPAIRNMGTIGGSAAFADPAADYLPALLVTDAVLELAGPEGRRDVPANEFFKGWMETVLAENEIIVSVKVPPAPPGSIGIYRKMARVAGDFATMAVALMLAMDGDTCTDIRVGIGGCNPTPVRVPAAEAGLVGTNLNDDDVAAAAQMITDACEPQSDVRASAAYRRRVLPRMIGRVINKGKEMAAK